MGSTQSTWGLILVDVERYSEAEGREEVIYVGRLVLT